MWLPPSSIAWTQPSRLFVWSIPEEARQADFVALAAINPKNKEKLTEYLKEKELLEVKEIPLIPPEQKVILFFSETQTLIQHTPVRVVNHTEEPTIRYDSYDESNA